MGFLKKLDFFCFCLTSWLLTLVSLYAHADYLDEKAVEQVQSFFGPVLSREHHPTLYGLFTQSFDGERPSIIDLLGQTTLQINEGKGVAINKFYIIESTEPLIRLHIDHDQGSRAVLSSIFISTAELKRMFSVSSAEGFSGVTQSGYERGMRLLAGAMALHFSGPQKRINTALIVGNRYASGGSVAETLAIDLEATELIERAGLPVELVSEYLQYLKSHEIEKETMGIRQQMGGADIDLRLSAMETYLTARRYQRGYKGDSIQFRSNVDWVQIDEVLADKQRLVRYYVGHPPSGSFQDLISELNRVNSDFYRKLEEYEKETKGEAEVPKALFWSYGIRSNQIMVAILEHLVSEPTPENFNDLKVVFEQAFMKLEMYHLLWDQLYLDHVIRELGLESEVKLRAPTDFIVSHSFFRSDVVFDWVRANLKLFWRSDRYITGAPMAIMPPDKFAELLFVEGIIPGPRLPDVEWLARILGQGASVTGPTSLALSPHIIAQFMKSHFLRMNQTEASDFILKFAFRNPQGILPNLVRSYSVNKFGIIETYHSHEIVRLKKRMAGGDEKAIDVYENYRKWLEVVWEHRGLFAFFEVVRIVDYEYDGKAVSARAEVIDWHTIGRELGIAVDQVDRLVWAAYEELVIRQEPGSLEVFREMLSSKFAKQLIPHINTQYSRHSRTPVVSEPFTFFVPELSWYKSQGSAGLPREFFYMMKDIFPSAFAAFQYDIRANRDHYEQRFVELFTERVRGIHIYQEINHALINEIYEQAKADLFGQGVDVTWEFSKEKTQHKVIMESNLSTEQKGRWLYHMLLNDAPGTVVKNSIYRLDIENWRHDFLQRSKEKNQLFLDDLIRLGVIPDIVDFIEEMKSKLVADFGSSTGSVINAKYFNLLSGAARSIVEAIQRQTPEAASIDNLDRVLSLMEPPNKGETDKAYRSGVILIKRALIDQYETLYQRILGPVQFFRKMTEFGATPDTDRFFRNHFIKVHSDGDSERLELLKVDSNVLLVFLEDERFKENHFRAQLTRLVIEPMVKEMRAMTVIPSDEIWRLFKMINTFNPQASEEKDRLLDDLSWRLRLEGEILDAFVEENRSSNIFHPKNMKLPKWASVMNGVLRYLSPRLKWQTIEYLRDPLGPQSDRYLTDLENELREVPVKEFEGIDGFLRKDISKPIKYEIIRYIIGEFEQFALQAGQYEKAFLMNNVFKSGKHPIFSEAHFLDRAIAYMGVQKGSEKDGYIRAFLQTIRPQEVGVSLGYLLSAVKGDQTDYAELFKIFQTIGVKFGQTAGIWKILSDEVNKQTEKLKDKAGALTKRQILDILAETHPGQNIKLLKVLGSASIKSVILVQLPSGKSAVLLVRNPYILDQISSNLELSKRFLDALEANKIYEGSAFFRMIVNALEAQIYREVDFRNEMKALVELQSVFTGIEKWMRKKKPQIWTNLALVQPVTELDYNERVAFITEAKGVTFDKLQGVAREEAGRLAVEISLRMFFKYGYFEPDRHKGNFLFHEKTGTIYFFDVGQLEHYKPKLGWDDRLTIVEMMRSIRDQKVDLFIEMALKIASERSDGESEKIGAIRSEVNQLFAKHGDDFEILLREAVKALAENGVEIKHNYVFGILKGLMTLYGEKYVSKEQFFEIVESQAQRLYIKKAYLPRVLPTLVSRALNKLVGRGSEPQMQIPQASHKKQSRGGGLLCRDLFSH